MKKLSGELRRKFQRETLILYLKMLAIVIPVGGTGIAVIVVLFFTLGDKFVWPAIPVGLATVLSAAFLAVLYASLTYIKPLIKIEEFCRQLKAGNLRALEDLEGAGIMKEVAETLNGLSEALSEFLANARITSGNLSATSENLLEISETSNSNLQEISRAVVNLAGKTEEQMSGVSRVETATDEILANIKSVEEAARQAQDFSEQVVQTVAGGTDAVKRAAEKMSEIKTATDVLAGLVGKLDEQSGQIGVIVEVISSIADETKLLSLNASIEAARAGEQGRGFAVVASEVGRLAEGSADAAAQIENLLNQIRNGVSQAMKAMQEGSEKVAEGSLVTSEARSMLEEINRSSEKISQFIRSITDATLLMEPNNREVMEAVKSIALITEQVATNMQEVSASIQEQAGSVQELTAMMHELENMSSNLNALISAYTPSGPRETN